MTRKDYEVIAKVLQQHRNRVEDAIVDPAVKIGEQRRFENLIEDFAFVLGRDNPRFDEERFRAAIES